MAIRATGQATIIDVTDAYSIILTSEAYTFPGTTSGASAGQKCATQAVAYCGQNQCPVVVVDVKSIICPTGITATVTDSGTASPTITFTTTAVITSSCEATVPVTVDGITINKKFSFAVAKTGATGAKGDAGRSITGVTNYYLATSAATGVTTAASGWTTTMQTTDTTKKYLWCYQSIAYSSGNPTTTTPVIIGTHGATGNTGATGKGIKSVTNYYLTTSTGTGVKTDTSGWTTTPTATTVTNKYIWCYQLITYTDNTTEKTTPAIIGTHGATGATGAAGKDAVVVTVTASNGTMFKNNNGSTVLTAHVFKGGVEQSITDAGVCGSLGSIKWYKAGSSTAVATSKTLTISANDVDSVAVYTCNLEG